MEQFAVGEDLTHLVGNAHCPACVEDFPEPCRCGGLVHATALDLLEDPDTNPVITTRCDQCGLSDEDLAEAV